MSRYVHGEVPREGSRHVERNEELGATLAVKLCERADGTTGIAVLARRLMFVLHPGEAVEIADALVDAVEATGGHEG